MSSASNKRSEGGDYIRDGDVFLFQLEVLAAVAVLLIKPFVEPPLGFFKALWHVGDRAR